MTDILEVVLKCHIEVEGITSVTKANAYERAATWKRAKIKKFSQ